MSGDRRYPRKASDARTLVEVLAVLAGVSAVGRLALWMGGAGPAPDWWDGRLWVVSALVLGLGCAWLWRRRLRVARVVGLVAAGLLVAVVVFSAQEFAPGAVPVVQGALILVGTWLLVRRRARQEAAVEQARQEALARLQAPAPKD